jgi:hypothetical protein
VRRFIGYTKVNSKHRIAVEYIGRAIRLKGNVAAFHINLGNAMAGTPCYHCALTSDSLCDNDSSRAHFTPPRHASPRRHRVAESTMLTRDSAIPRWRLSLLIVAIGAFNG